MKPTKRHNEGAFINIPKFLLIGSPGILQTNFIDVAYSGGSLIFISGSEISSEYKEAAQKYGEFFTDKVRVRLEK